MINEYSVIDKVQENYDSKIIDFNGKVRPDVREKILKMVYKISIDLDVKIDGIYIIGSSITKQYTENSDIDINVNLEKKLDPGKQKDLDLIVNYFYNEKIFIDKHPVNFKLVHGFKNKKADAMYDLVHDVWIKKPVELKNSDIEKIISKCKKTKNYEKAIKDYEILTNAIYEYYTEDNLTDKTKSDLEQIIFTAINDLVRDANKIKKIRRNMISDKEISDKYLSANYRCSNIVYKLLESYGIYKIVHILNEYLKYLTPEEFIENIKKIKNEY